MFSLPHVITDSDALILMQRVGQQVDALAADGSDAVGPTGWNGTAYMVRGNIQTANATLHIIDSILMALSKRRPIGRVASKRCQEVFLGA